MSEKTDVSLQDISAMSVSEKLALLSSLKMRSDKNELSGEDRKLASALGVDFPNDPDEWLAAEKTLKDNSKSPDDEDPDDDKKDDDPSDDDGDDPDEEDDDSDDEGDEEDFEPNHDFDSTPHNPTKSDSEEPEPPGSKLTTEFENVGIVQGRNLAVGGRSWMKMPSKSTGKPKTSVGKTLAESLNNAAMRLINTPAGKDRRTRLSEGFVARAIPEHKDMSFFNQIVEMAYETSGAGGQQTQLAQVFSRIDRYSRSMVPPNAVFKGFTFFTRPRLCLTDWNIISDRKLSSLRTNDNLGIPFAIRCLLDTQFAHDSQNAKNCPLFDSLNPFLVPLCNAVKNISGFNDPTLVTETTEGGFFSEDQTYVIGGDRMARTYDLNCTFKDYPGSPILALVDYWCQYMANLTDGSLQQYADAIDANRIDYTISIYRFLMDRTNQNITRWCKCTGCYPVSPPSGVSFNMNDGENMVNAALELNVPFKVNRIEYDDPVILKEFNMLVRRYGGQELFGSGKVEAFDTLPQNNFSGIPYIRPGSNGYELVWLRRKSVVGEYAIAPATKDVEDIKQSRGDEGSIKMDDQNGQTGKAVI